MVSFDNSWESSGEEGQQDKHDKEKFHIGHRKDPSDPQAKKFTSLTSDYDVHIPLPEYLSPIILLTRNPYLSGTWELNICFHYKEVAEMSDQQLLRKHLLIYILFQKIYNL